MNKTKKIIISLAAFFSAVIVSATSIYAATKSYQLRDIDLVISAPDDLLVFTRETTSSDPNYSYIDMDPIEFTADMEQRSLYFYATPKDSSFDITVTAVNAGNSDEDYNSLDSEELDSVIATNRKTIESTGFVNLNDVSIISHSQTPIVMYDIENSADASGLETVYMLECDTIYGGITYSIKFQSYGSEITDDQRSLFTDMINSLEFKEIKGSSTQARILSETYEMLIGTLITVAILGIIIFIMNVSRKNKKKHVL